MIPQELLHNNTCNKYSKK